MLILPAFNLDFSSLPFSIFVPPHFRVCLLVAGNSYSYLYVYNARIKSNLCLGSRPQDNGLQELYALDNSLTGAHDLIFVFDAQGSIVAIQA